MRKMFILGGMIKANEFRLGNYFEYDGMAFGLGGIYEHEVYGTSDAPISRTVRVDDVENVFPIPLTEEWLLKFGFDRKTKSVTVFEKDEIIFPLHSDVGRFRFAYNNSSSVKILFVHQLQNLYFALTGAELTSQTPLPVSHKTTEQ